jgi:hypothetical protein
MYLQYKLLTENELVESIDMASSTKELLSIKTKLNKKHFRKILNKILDINKGHSHNICKLFENDKESLFDFLDISIGDPDVIYGERYGLPIEILEKFSNSNNWVVKRMLANDVNCPSYILDKLSDESSHIKGLIAAHGNCSIETLEKLSCDVDSYVACMAISNANCPIYMLEMLSNSELKDFRMAVVNNYNCPVHILKKLGNDKNSNIADIAIDKLKHLLLIGIGAV